MKLSGVHSDFHGTTAMSFRKSRHIQLVFGWFVSVLSGEDDFGSFGRISLWLSLSGTRGVLFQRTVLINRTTTRLEAALLSLALFLPVIQNITGSFYFLLLLFSGLRCVALNWMMVMTTKRSPTNSNNNKKVCQVCWERETECPLVKLERSIKKRQIC